jgi:GT2 family glycosyltransferase
MLIIKLEEQLMINNNLPKVSIILLNYNGYQDTIECFESLEKISYTNYNIIIVDNDSPDKSIDKINAYMHKRNLDYEYYENIEFTQNTIPDKFITLIQSGSNRGYGHGNNIGIKYGLKSNSDYILLLNNDTIVEKDFLEPLVKELVKNKNIGIVSSQIFYEDRRNIFWENGGNFNLLTGKVSHIDFNQKDTNQINNEYCNFLSGCLWLIPRKIFLEIGYINEDYFMYVEDLEYCQRVVKKNYKLKVSSKSKIYHKVGSSSGGEISPFSIYWMTKNYLKFMIHNVNVFFWPIFITNNILRFTIKFILSGKNDLLKKQFLAFYDFILRK